MNRKLSVIATTFLLAVSASAASKPNIVFILADDLGWADTTLYGHTKYYRTPNIERLAKRGMTFSRAYTASPLCSPTRSSILTGLNPARTGLTTPNCHLPQVTLKAVEGTQGPPNKKSIGPTPVTRLDPKYYTLGEALKDAGYATGHFGKWHLGKEPYSPLEHGFDVDVPHWHGPGPAGSFVAPWKFPDFDPDTPNEHLEDRMAREAVDFLESHKDEPFFLNYWMFSVHAPFDAKKDLIENYRKQVDLKDPQRSPTYAAMIESMDDAVGTLMDTLDRLGLSENTIVIFFSDNGGNMYNTVDDTTPTSNAPLRGGKASMYEGGVRVPLVVSWPGVVTPETRNESRVQSDDFYPTILDMLRLKPRAGQKFDGVSFLPALKGQPHRRGPSFTYFPHDPPVPDWIPPSVSVHDGDWKLIRIFHSGEDGAHRWKLFDLRNDIGERNNLAAKDPARVKHLDALIEKFLNHTGAVRPIVNTKFNPALHRPEQEGVGRIRTKGKPARKKKRAANDSEFPGLKGWKARKVKYSVKNGVVRLTSRETTPYLGVTAGVSGPAQVTFQIRSPKGGKAKIEWLPTRDKAQSVPYETQGGDWQTITVDIPAKGPLGIFRIYVPAQSQTVEIDSIELRPVKGKPRGWDF
jgi:arylsulfatase A-like enzyme